MAAFCVQFDPELNVMRETLVRGRGWQAPNAITKFQASGLRTKPDVSFTRVRARVAVDQTRSVPERSVSPGMLLQSVPEHAPAWSEAQ